MNIFKNLSTVAAGAVFVALGTVGVAPLQATTQTGYETFEDEMAGMKVRLISLVEALRQLLGVLQVSRQEEHLVLTGL